MVKPFTKFHGRVLAVSVSVLAIGLVVINGFSGTAKAAGDAYFTLSPSSGSYTVGSSLTVTVYETSTAGDNTNAVDANLTYNTSLLRFNSMTNPVFTLCGGAPTGGGGSISYGCADSSTVSGTQVVSQISFTALASGAANVSMITGSGGSTTDIDSSSGSVWNRVLPSVNYTLSAPASSSPSGGSTKPKTTTTKSTTPVKTTTTATPETTSNPSTPPAAATAATSTTTAAKTTPKGSLTITVVGSDGKPVNNALVVLDNYYSEITNKKGQAGFSGLKVGSHTVKVTAIGQKTVSQTVNLLGGQTKTVSLKLAAASSMLWLYITLPVILVLAGGSYGFYMIRLRPRVPRPTPPAVGPDGMGTAAPPPPSMPSTTIAPTQTAGPASPVAQLVSQPPTVTPGSSNHPLSF